MTFRAMPNLPRIGVICDHPRDRRSKMCIKCHARVNALKNHASGVVQSDEAKRKRTEAYKRTRMAYVPPGREAENILMRDNGIKTSERAAIFGREIVREHTRAMHEREARRKRDEY